MELQVKDKVFMLAASSKGLGYGIARELAKDGAIVCLASRTETELDQAAKKLHQETGTEVFPFIMDAVSPDSIHNWTKAVINRFGRIDGLLVNAGGPPAGGFQDFTDNNWQKLLN